MKKKYKTLNNWVCITIVENLFKHNYRGVFVPLFNYGDLLEKNVLEKICDFIYNWFNYDSGFIIEKAHEECDKQVADFIEYVFKIKP